MRQILTTNEVTRCPPPLLQPACVILVSLCTLAPVTPLPCVQKKRYGSAGEVDLDENDIEFIVSQVRTWLGHSGLGTVLTVTRVCCVHHVMVTGLGHSMCGYWSSHRGTVVDGVGAMGPPVSPDAIQLGVSAAVGGGVD